MNLTLLNLAPAAEATTATAATAISPAATANGLADGLLPEESGLDFAGQLDAQLSQLAAGLPGSALTAAGEPKGKGVTALTADSKAALVAATATGKTTAGKTQAADLVSQLAAAVEKLTQPGTAPAALASRDARVEKSDTAVNAEKEDDQQAIQSLFAMLGLPAPVMAPAQAANAATVTAEATGGDAALTRAAGLTTALTASAPAAATPAASGAPALQADAETSAAAAPAVAPAESLESAAMLLSSAQPQKEAAVTSPDSAPQQAVAMPVAAATAAAAPAVAAPALASAPVLSSPLASPEWQQALGQQVMMFTRQGQQSAELRLHPEDLGALQISLKIDNNQAQLHFASPHQQVRAAVEAAMPHLRTALAESGISLGQSSVGGDGSAWQNPQQSAQQQGSRSTPGSWNATDARAAAEPLAVPASLASRLGGGSGVDIFA